MTNGNDRHTSIIDGKLRYALPIALMLIAVGFMAYGIFDGEMKVVFNKAIELCKECVGIG